MIVVSACLLGDNCKYNGKNNRNQKIIDFLKGKEYIKICPETSGGLPTPRDPSEIVGSSKDVLKGSGKVLSNKGTDVTKNYIDGSFISYNMIKDKDVKLIILKAKSPSCGVGKVYDGTFSKTLIDGNGVCAELFLSKGYKVVTELDF